jgi:hypothetical protein
MNFAWTPGAVEKFIGRVRAKPTAATNDKAQRELEETRRRQRTLAAHDRKLAGVA